ncbi:MAG: cytochrome c [candidate division KSB1 bacterium]|nr:cytochrome c [candidate division KSB1 bacterium]MDZ7364331.1 cytochrome c [candidate division KSB1 bacterium]MDZ7402703.1 cytochrome c [candidate division KSB1 bacterium]
MKFQALALAIWCGVVCDGWPQEIAVNNVLDGKLLYEEYAGCASCHGLDGKGQAEGVTLDPPPPDLSDCSFNSREPRRDWRAVIQHGGPARGLSMAMPAYADVLTETQVEAIIDYLKTFCVERGWPQGELNFRRAQITSKAFPENEALLIPSYTRKQDNAAATKLVYERRFGRRAHWEIAVPFETEWATPTARGVGDVELSAKYAFLDDYASLTIASGGLEVALPTGKTAAGIGSGTWKASPYLAAGKGFKNFTLQSSVKLEMPLQSQTGETELLYNLAFTRPLTKEKKGFFPMLEVNGVTNVENGATQFFLTPQLYIGLVKRGHIAFSLGSQIPVAGEKPFDFRLLGFLLWEYADGGLWW